MPNYNLGAPIRFPNGCKLYIGAAVGSIEIVDNVVDGSIEFSAPGYEKIPYKQGGRLRDIIAGDERESMLKFELYRSPVLEALLTVMRPAIASGEQPTFFARVEIPDYLNATTGRRYDFSACYMPDDVLHRTANLGPEFDKVSIELRNFENAPTKSSY